MHALGFIGGVSGGEMLLVFGIALLLFGAKRLPGLARQLGRSVEQFRRAAQQVREEFINADHDLERAAEAKSAPPPASTTEPYDPARADVGPEPGDDTSAPVSEGMTDSGAPEAGRLVIPETVDETPSAAGSEPEAAPSREGEHRGGEGI
jgi:sec-independent protein translocase protein TatA